MAPQPKEVVPMLRRKKLSRSGFKAAVPSDSELEQIFLAEQRKGLENGSSVEDTAISTAKTLFGRINFNRKR
jgi:hypothetical protein